MRTARNIALVVAVATMAACTGGPAPCGAEFGDPHGEMPDLYMLAGDTVETSLVDHFSAPDCSRFYEGGDETWEVRSADPAAVAVSVSEHVLTTVAIEAADSVRVTVKAEEDRFDPVAFHEFFVSVTAPR